jgi:hypothetical protein
MSQKIVIEMHPFENVMVVSENNKNLFEIESSDGNLYVSY